MSCSCIKIFPCLSKYYISFMCHVTLLYFRFWMQELLVQVWNVTGLEDATIALQNLTSNGIERYNRHFNGIVPTSHPNLAVFAAALQQEVDEVVQHIENIKKCQDINPKHKAAVFLEIPEEYESFKFKVVDAKKKSERRRGKKK